MKKIIFLFLMVLISPEFYAQISTGTLAGEYKYVHQDLDSAYLILKADSTFSYYWRWNDFEGCTHGKWIKKGKYIYLNSDTLPNLKSTKDKDRFTVQASRDSTLKQSVIRLKDVNGVPIMDADCWTDQSRFKTDSSGVGRMDDDNPRYISVSMKFADSFITFHNKDKYNVFDITVLDVNLHYLYKKNEFLLPVYVNNSLYLKEGFSDKKATYEFRKVK
jgi:hypothetical protein